MVTLSLIKDSVILLSYILIYSCMAYILINVSTKTLYKNARRLTGWKQCFESSDNGEKSCYYCSVRNHGKQFPRMMRKTHVLRNRSSEVSPHLGSEFVNLRSTVKDFGSGNNFSSIPLSLGRITKIMRIRSCGGTSNKKIKEMCFREVRH